LFLILFITVILTSFSAQYSSTVNAPDANGNTPLSLAISDENVNMIKLLLKNKLDPNTPINENNETLIMWASRTNNSE